MKQRITTWRCVPLPCGQHMAISSYIWQSGRIVRRADLSHLESLQQAAVHIGLTQQSLIHLSALGPTQKQYQHKSYQVQSWRPRHPAQCARIESLLNKTGVPQHAPITGNWALFEKSREVVRFFFIGSWFWLTVRRHECHAVRTQLASISLSYISDHRELWNVANTEKTLELVKSSSSKAMSTVQFLRTWA